MIVLRHLLRRPRSCGPIFVCPLDEAGAIARRMPAGLVVSISDPERRDVTREILGRIKARICPLDFHDIEREAPGLFAPAPRHIDAALQASDRVPARKTVLVHCHAGISRSSALALILAAHRRMRSGETRDSAVDLAVSQVHAATPHARPNMRVIELGAAALDLGKTAFVDRAWGLHRGGA